MFPSLLLFLGAVIGATTFTHEFTDNDLVAGCRFHLGERHYDLCPLVLEGGNQEVRTRLPVQGVGGNVSVERAYSFVFRGMQHNRECPKGTWVCLKETQTFDEARTIHRAIAGKIRPASSMVDQGTNAIASIFHEDISPHLFLIGGFHQDGPQYVGIDFLCDPSVGVGNPSFVEERFGVHSFTWATKYGCPIPQNGLTPNLNTALHTVDGEQKPETLNSNTSDPDEDDGSDLLDANTPLKTSRRWMALFLLATGILFIFIYILISSPRVRHIVLTYCKSVTDILPFRTNPLLLLPQSLRTRVGESRLSHWTQEDVLLGLMETTTEVDVMFDDDVLGTEDNDWMGKDEYIPLKTRMLKNPKNYGSAGDRDYW